MKHESVGKRSNKILIVSLVTNPFIYDEPFADNLWTCIFRRLLACFKSSICFRQLAFQLFKSLHKTKWTKTCKMVFSPLYFPTHSPYIKYALSYSELKTNKKAGIMTWMFGIMYTYWTRTFHIEKDNPQNLLYSYLILLLIKLRKT